MYLGQHEVTRDACDALVAEHGLARVVHLTLNF